MEGNVEAMTRESLAALRLSLLKAMITLSAGRTKLLLALFYHLKASNKLVGLGLEGYTGSSSNR